MKRFALIPALAALVMAGTMPACKDESARHAETKKPEASAPAAAQAPAKTESSAARPEPAAAKPAEAAKTADATQDSPMGAARLFVAAMAAGDIRRAAELNDPASESHAKLVEFADIIDMGKAKGAPVEIIAGAASKAWVGAEITMGEEQGRNARAAFKLASGKTIEATMQKTDGKWYVFGDESVLQMSGEKPAAPAAAPGSPAPAPAQPQPAPAGEQPPK